MRITFCLQASSGRKSGERLRAGITHGSPCLSDRLCPVGEEQEGMFGKSGTRARVENPGRGLKPKADHEHRPGKEPRNRGSTCRKRGVASEGPHKVRRMEMCLQLSLSLQFCGPDPPPLTSRICSTPDLGRAG